MYQYDIVRLCEDDVDRVIQFQFGLQRQYVSKKGRSENLNTTVLLPAVKKLLIDSAKIRMLYAVIDPETTEILSFMAGYSPVAAIRNEKLKQIMSIAQYSLGEHYLLFVQFLSSSEEHQKQMFNALFEEIERQAYFFEFQQIVIPTKYNRYLQEFLGELNFYLADSYIAQKDSTAINFWCQYM